MFIEMRKQQLRAAVYACTHTHTHANTHVHTHTHTHANTHTHTHTHTQVSRELYESQLACIKDGTSMQPVHCVEFYPFPDVSFSLVHVYNLYI